MATSTDSTCGTEVTGVGFHFGPAMEPMSPTRMVRARVARMSGQVRMNRRRSAGRTPMSEPETLQELRVLLPVLRHLDVQIQVYGHPEQFLDLSTGRRAYTPEPGAALADDDRLLGGALHEHVHPHVDEPVGAVLTGNDLVDEHRDGVRQFLTHPFQGGLAHEFRDEYVVGFVGEFPLGVEHRSFGELVDDEGGEQVELVSGDGGEGHDVCPVAEGLDRKSVV